jgi:hypothetical protein
MAKIENIDLGIITTIEQIEKKTFIDVSPVGALGVYNQNLINEQHEWRIEGELIDPTQDSIESLNNIRSHGLIVFIDLSDQRADLLGFGKVVNLRKIDEENVGTLTDYEMILRFQPAVALTRLNIDQMYLHDLDYRAKFSYVDPHFGKHGKTYTSALIMDYQLYVDNYKNAAQDAIIEIQCGDDIDKIEVYGWKAAAWSAIGTWGTGGTAWGTAGSAWTDGDAVSHTPTVDRGDRGEAVSVGTISLNLGCKKRILLKITNFTSGSGVNHLSTKYGSYQLKLKVKLTHTQRESLRPYPLITYVEGGLEAGVP